MEKARGRKERTHPELAGDHGELFRILARTKARQELPVFRTRVHLCVQWSRAIAQSLLELRARSGSHGPTPSLLRWVVVGVPASCGCVCGMLINPAASITPRSHQNKSVFRAPQRSCSGSHSCDLRETDVAGLTPKFTSWWADSADGNRVQQDQREPARAQMDRQPTMEKLPEGLEVDSGCRLRGLHSGGVPLSTQIAQSGVDFAASSLDPFGKRVLPPRQRRLSPRTTRRCKSGRTPLSLSRDSREVWAVRSRSAHPTRPPLERQILEGVVRQAHPQNGRGRDSQR